MSLERSSWTRFGYQSTMEWMTLDWWWCSRVDRYRRLWLTSKSSSDANVREWGVGDGRKEGLKVITWGCQLTSEWPSLVIGYIELQMMIGIVDIQISLEDGEDSYPWWYVLLFILLKEAPSVELRLSRSKHDSSSLVTPWRPSRSSSLTHSDLITKLKTWWLLFF